MQFTANVFDGYARVCGADLTNGGFDHVLTETHDEGVRLVGLEHRAVTRHGRVELHEIAHANRWQREREDEEGREMGTLGQLQIDREGLAEDGLTEDGPLGDLALQQNDHDQPFLHLQTSDSIRSVQKKRDDGRFA